MNEPDDKSKREEKNEKEEGSREVRGMGRGMGRGRGRRGRGRPRVDPSINYRWDDVSGRTVIYLSEMEMEVLRLCDGESDTEPEDRSYTQEEAAEIMSVSRGTIWRALKSARKKLANAVRQGKLIEIKREE
jgi:hypothetical protein